MSTQHLSRRPLEFPLLPGAAALLFPLASAAADVSDIELRRLLEPTPSELAQEQKGRIYIYEGLRESDIERAMRDQFHRVESMMFIRTQQTDEAGNLERDKATGEVLIDDDGC